MEDLGLRLDFQKTKERATNDVLEFGFVGGFDGAVRELRQMGRLDLIKYYFDVASKQMAQSVVEGREELKKDDKKQQSEQERLQGICRDFLVRLTTPPEKQE